jgi:hypothetical protein
LLLLLLLLLLLTLLRLTLLLLYAAGCCNASTQVNDVFGAIVARAAKPPTPITKQLWQQRACVLSRDSHASPSTTAADVSVVSWNVLAEYMAQKDSSPMPWDERLNAIVQHIVHLDADIVCLQEVQVRAAPPSTPSCFFPVLSRCIACAARALALRCSRFLVHLAGAIVAEASNRPAV